MTSKGQFGSRGRGHLKHTERQEFQLYNDKCHILSICSAHAQEESLKLLDLKNTYYHATTSLVKA